MSKITGIVKEVSTPKSGITIFIYERDTGILVDSTTSAVDGTFTFNGLDQEKAYTITALSTNEQFNNAIDDGIIPVGCDPNWNEVYLYLQFEGANNGGVFTDSSSYERVISKTGSPITSTTDPKIGVTSGYFDLNNNLYLSDASVFYIGSNDFTLEAWIKITSNLASSYHVIVSQRAGYSSLHNFSFLVNGIDLGGKLTFEWGSPIGGAPVFTLVDSVNLSLNIWYHVAISKTGNTFRLFKNGAIVASTTSSSVGYNSSSLPLIGKLASGYSFYGYMDELRFTKGVGRYVSDFSSNLQTESYPIETC